MVSSRILYFFQAAQRIYTMRTPRDGVKRRGKDPFYSGTLTRVGQHRSRRFQLIVVRCPARRSCLRSRPASSLDVVFSGASDSTEELVKQFIDTAFKMSDEEPSQQSKPPPPAAKSSSQPHQSDTQSSDTRSESTALDVIKRHWLIAGVFITILVGTFLPGGSEKDYWLAVFVSFACGITTTYGKMKHACKQAKLYTIVQAYSFIAVPLVFKALAILFGLVGILTPAIWRGLVITACLPASFNTATILNFVINGNDPAALISAIISNIVGLVFTPFLIVFLVGSVAPLPMIQTIIDVTVVLLAPMALGHGIRHAIRFRNHIGIPFNQILEVILLFSLYMVIGEAMVAKDDVGFGQITLLTVIVMIVMIILQLIIFGITSNMKHDFLMRDVVAITYSSTHKSQDAGLPIMKKISNNAVPLMVYQLSQIFLGTVVVGILKEEEEKED
uniref:Uncharacterized protein n=1 Tax=Timema shepardi TaxID=629360 RepID=A0A7R9AYX5_TIMSH|nr:unnamed protein product [Timema shepardi]